jgi:uncharacterized protein YecE (DUF72 family)
LTHSDADFVAYLEQTEKAIGISAVSKLFRPPGGVAWPNQLRLAQAHGYKCVLGCAYPHDPIRPPVWYMKWLVGKNLENWNAGTPEGFVFSVKVPQTITHDKVLVDCDAEFSEFMETMDILGPKLGPIVFQFPFFAKNVLRDRHEFTDRLVPFLKKLPADHKFGIEIRNRDWLNTEFADLLRDHQIALVLQDRSWMPNPLELQFDPITVNWTYIRWLGDRKQIEAQTMTWDKAVVDRTAELTSWVDFCYRIMKRGVLIYAYANNHYGGHAPATIEQFRSLWCGKGLPEIEKPERKQLERNLFE